MAAQETVALLERVQIPLATPFPVILEVGKWVLASEASKGLGFKQPSLPCPGTSISLSAKTASSTPALPTI